MQFIVSHGDIFHAILLDRRANINLHALQELALTTAVISRANCMGTVSCTRLMFMCLNQGFNA